MPEDLLLPRALMRAAKPLPTLVPNCGRCGLQKGGCKTPVMRVYGGGARGVLFVGEYPGKKEDAFGRPFVGPAGEKLREHLEAQDFDLDRDGWATNALRCHDHGKARPKTGIEDCRPHLLRTVAELKPSVVVLMGQAAVASLVGAAWKPDVGPLNRWTGRLIPCQRPNAWLACTWNPGFLLKPEADRVTHGQFAAHLAAALAQTGPPWPDGPPDYRSQVRVEPSPEAAAAWLRGVTTGPVAVDYETTTLKPDGHHADIVCCAVAHRELGTLAFPWHGPVVAEMRRILADPAVGKIASNLDMEARWTERVLGARARGWAWDTMLGAHCFDPRPGGKERDDGTATGSGTTGLKFQAFVALGQAEYNSHLEDHLRPAGADQSGNAPNRVRELPFKDLALYCGLDALLELYVAEAQAAFAGVEL